MVMVAVGGVHPPVQVLPIREREEGEAQKPAPAPKSPGQADERHAVHRVDDRSDSKEEHEPEPGHNTQSHEPHMLDQLISMRQIVSLAGALMVLGAFAALQRGRLTIADRSYHVLNLMGSGILAVMAVLDRNAGFILLEGMWALFSIPGTIKPRGAKGLSQ
jgi:hypothetical protein